MYGQTGLNVKSKKIIKSPVKHSFFNDNNSVSIMSHGIYNHCVFIYTNTGQLFKMGTKYTKANKQRFRKRFDTRELMKYKFKSRLTQIECGEGHALFLSLMGNLYGCGSNVSKELFNDNNRITTDKIIAIQKLKNITDIACAYNTSFAIDNNNIFYGSGVNNSGLFGSNGNTNSITIKNPKFIHVEAGYGNVCCLTIDNKVYCWGYNSYGQCGNGSDDPELTQPTQINIGSESSDILSVKCGSSHTIIKMNNKRYYVFGNNQRGQIFLENLDEIHEPTLLTNKDLCQKIGNNGEIIDLIPGFYQTFILQKTV